MRDPLWMEGDDFALDDGEVCDECGEECDCGEDETDSQHDAWYED